MNLAKRSQLIALPTRRRARQFVLLPRAVATMAAAGARLSVGLAVGTLVSVVSALMGAFAERHIPKGVGVMGLAFFDPVDRGAALDGGSVVVVVVAEGFDDFFVALHVFNAFLGCPVNVLSVFVIDFQELGFEQ